MEEVEFIRMKEYISEELYQSGISQEIYDNPRYQMILNELAKKMMDRGVKPHSSEAIKQLFGPMFIDEEGNVVFHEEHGKRELIERIYIDKTDRYLKRVSYTKSGDKDIEQPTIRTYDDNGIEICVAFTELNDENKVITKVSRRSDSLDTIRCQSIRKGLLSGMMEREGTSYRKREDYRNLHDIFPDGGNSYRGYSKRSDRPVFSEGKEQEGIYKKYVEATDERALKVFEKTIAEYLGVDKRKEARDD